MNFSWLFIGAKSWGNSGPRSDYGYGPSNTRNYMQTMADCSRRLTMGFDSGHDLDGHGAAAGLAVMAVFAGVCTPWGLALCTPILVDPQVTIVRVSRCETCGATDKPLLSAPWRSSAAAASAQWRRTCQHVTLLVKLASAARRWVGYYCFVTYRRSASCSANAWSSPSS